MEECTFANWALSRRNFLGLSGAVAASALLRLYLPTSGTAAVAAEPSAGVTVATVFLDQPYVDRTGRAVPYRPPAVVGLQLSNDYRGYGFAIS